MRTIRFLLATAVVLVAAGCSFNNPVVKRSDIPAGAQIAVIDFRDCRITGQKECDGSGSTAGSVFVRVLTASNKVRAVTLSRPVGPKESLSNAAAVELAKAKGFPFVLNGEVDQFFSVATSKSQGDIAGVSIRILRVSDGLEVASFSQTLQANDNMVTPDQIIEDLARHVAQSL